jgi:hypothetical protein
MDGARTIRWPATSRRGNYKQHCLRILENAAAAMSWHHRKLPALWFSDFNLSVEEIHPISLTSQALFMNGQAILSFYIDLFLQLTGEICTADRF